MSNQLFAARLSDLGNENAFKVGADIARVEAAGRSVIKLNLGEPDFDSAANINKVAIDNIEAGNSHYCDPQGIAEFRQAVARTITRTRGVDMDPERVVVTSGGKPPIAYSLLSYVDAGDEVIYPNPGFPIYQSWVGFVHAVPKPLPLRENKGFRFDIDDLERLVGPKTKLIILNSPSNPTGGVLTGEDLDRIAELLQARAHPQFRILSDEVYEEIVFDGARHESIISRPGMAERTIILNSHSKTFAMTGWRVGYAALPTVEEALVFKQWNINTYSCSPPFIQMAAAEALNNPDNIDIVAGMRTRFQERRDAVIPALNDIPGISCATPAGAFYAFPNVGQACEDLGIMAERERLIGQGASPAPAATIFQMFALYHHAVATLDRAAFGTLDSGDEHYVRISLASDLQTLLEGVKRLATAAVDREGFSRFAEEKDLTAL